MLTSQADGTKPKPPWHPIMGNVMTMGEVAAAFPPSAHPHMFTHYLRQKYPDMPPVFYLDLWYGCPLHAILNNYS